MTTNSANTANTAIAKEAVETNGAQSQQTDRLRCSWITSVMPTPKAANAC